MGITVSLTDDLVDAGRRRRLACGAEIDFGSERLRSEQIVGLSDRQ
jgi:hypothetical protein